MAQPLLGEQTVLASRPAGGLRAALVWAATALGAIILLGTLTLWYHYGTTVFFEMIAAGVSACF
jgi:hypothetical protein